MVKTASGKYDTRMTMTMIQIYNMMQITYKEGGQLKWSMGRFHMMRHAPILHKTYKLLIEILYINMHVNDRMTL